MTYCLFLQACARSNPDLTVIVGKAFTKFMYAAEQSNEHKNQRMIMIALKKLYLLKTYPNV